MFIACVHIHVKPEYREKFIELSMENARKTREEPGNLRFDVIQSQEDENRFMLYEVYRDSSGMDAHKQTCHYAAWRDAMPAMMAEERYTEKYHPVYPMNAEEF